MVIWRSGLPTPPPPVGACPLYIGTIAESDQYPLELTTDGTEIYVVTYDTPFDRIATYSWPGLVGATSFASPGESVITSISADPFGNVCVGTGSGTVLHWTGSSWTVIYTATGGRTVATRRWCHAPSNAALVETRDIGGTKNIRISDMVISSGSSTELLAEQPIGDSAETGPVGAPVTTPDGAVWFTFYPGSTSPGRIYRWHSGTGLQRVPGVGIDGSPSFTSHPGPYTDTGIDLVPQADSSVAAHFASVGVEVGKLIAPDLGVFDFPCYDGLFDGPPLFSGSETMLRIDASANTPDLSAFAVSPFNGAFNYYWGLPAFGSDTTLLLVLASTESGDPGVDVPGFTRLFEKADRTDLGYLAVYYRQEATSSSYNIDAKSRQSTFSGTASSVTFSPGPNGAPDVTVNFAGNIPYAIGCAHVLGVPAVVDSGTATSIPHGIGGITGSHDIAIVTWEAGGFLKYISETTTPPGPSDSGGTPTIRMDDATGSFFVSDTILGVEHPFVTNPTWDISSGNPSFSEMFWWLMEFTP